MPQVNAEISKVMKKNVRVEIPRSPEKLIALAQLIVKQHKALGTASPLKGLNMADLEALLKVAAESQEKSQFHRKEAEAATEDRNMALGLDPKQNVATEGTVLFYVSSIKSILLGLNKGREQKLGSYGFEVDTSPRSGDNPTDEATAA